MWPERESLQASQETPRPRRSITPPRARANDGKFAAPVFRLQGQQMGLNARQDSIPQPRTRSCFSDLGPRARHQSTPEQRQEIAETCSSLYLYAKVLIWTSTGANYMMKLLILILGVYFLKAMNEQDAYSLLQMTAENCIGGHEQSCFGRVMQIINPPTKPDARRASFRLASSGFTGADAWEVGFPLATKNPLVVAVAILWCWLTARLMAYFHNMAVCVADLAASASPDPNPKQKYGDTPDLF